MPLVWAHAEYIKLLRSLRDGRVFDTPPQPVERYQRNNVRSRCRLALQSQMQVPPWRTIPAPRSVGARDRPLERGRLADRARDLDDGLRDSASISRICRPIPCQQAAGHDSHFSGPMTSAGKGQDFEVTVVAPRLSNADLAAARGAPAPWTRVHLCWVFWCPWPLDQALESSRPGDHARRERRLTTTRISSTVARTAAYVIGSVRSFFTRQTKWTTPAAAAR